MTVMMIYVYWWWLLIIATLKPLKHNFGDTHNSQSTRECIVNAISTTIQYIHMCIIYYVWNKPCSYVENVIFRNFRSTHLCYLFKRQAENKYGSTMVARPKPGSINSCNIIYCIHCLYMGFCVSIQPLLCRCTLHVLPPIWYMPIFISSSIM